MKVLTSLQIRNAEKSAVSNGLFSYADMMENAAKSAFDEIISRFKIIGKRFLVIVGKGNNGGDGIVLAGLLQSAGADVTVFYPLGIPQSSPAVDFVDAARSIPVATGVSGDYDFYIDALFGIGFNGEIESLTAELLYDIDNKPGYKIAIDVPSGMYADGGMANVVFKADLTVTFIGYKLCQLLPPTSALCGEVVLKDLGLDVSHDYSYNVINPPVARQYRKDSHKGTFGTVLTVCGSYGMAGAAILSAKAAATAGAGIVKSVVCDKNYTAFTSSVPEAVTIPVETSINGAPFLNDKKVFSAALGADAVLIGCGLGRSDEVITGITKVLSNINVPTVIDADGINAICRNINILKNISAPLVLTPHPGEMAALIGTTVEDVEKNRVLYAKRFACENKCVLVLKGCNTIVASPDGEIYFNVTGNYGMGKGGSGDILAGIIAALLANGYNPIDAALTSVYIHGLAGDRAAKKYTKRTMLPSDLLKELKFISF